MNTTPASSAKLHPVAVSEWPTPVTLGNRLRRVRVQAGLSIRDLAAKAEIDKGTLVKLEKGKTPTYRTLVRVCDALGVSVVQLLKPEADLEDAAPSLVAVHQRCREWRAPRSQVELDPDSKETVRYRPLELRETVAADDRVLLSWLACRLPGGKLNCWLLELRGPTEPTTHPGEEFVFCLRGRAKLTVAGRGYILDEGDAATFWCAELHGYEPADELGAQDPSVLLLSVWVAAADLASR
jgi:transcriptional regulator with XRE-family HTH domain